MLTSLMIGLHCLASLILMSLTAALAWSRRHEREDDLQTFLMMIASYALWTSAGAASRLFSLASLPAIPAVSFAATWATLTAGSVLNYACRLPNPGMTLRRRRVLKVSLLITFAISILPWLPGYITGSRLEDGVLFVDHGWSYFLLAGWSFFIVIVSLFSLVNRFRMETRPLNRLRLKYALWGITPGTIFTFIFSFALPSVSTELQRHTWIGSSIAVFVTAVIFIGISRTRLYDLQNRLHRMIFLFFIAAIGVGILYIPLGVYLSRFTALDLRVGLALFVALFLSHAFLAWFFPRISTLIQGKRANPDDLVRQVIALTADVERDVDEVCRDVAVLLKLSLPTEKIVAALPYGQRYRIMAPEGTELSTSDELTLMQLLNMNVRVTRALTRYVDEAAPDLGLAELAQNGQTGRKRRRILHFAANMLAQMQHMGFRQFIPVVTAGRPLAIFLLGSKTDGTPYFPSEQSTLRTIAAALSITLKNVDEYGRIARVNNALLEEKSLSLDAQPIQRIISVGSDRELVYRGRMMEETLREIDRAAEHDESVLVLGETGSGKDLAVHLIHAKSARKDAPLIAVNCAALADSLLENELFGHDRGAYTGADRTFPGLFEQAEGGVLFLDEIGEISETLQLRLLRVLEDRKVRRLGGKTVSVNIRIIAATNRDLKERVDRGSFRADLYYRLNVIAIRLAPLRERREDIPVLVNHFIHRYADKFSRVRPRVSTEAMRLLQQYDWPGNVRELENAMLRAFVNSQSDTLTMADFPEAMARAQPLRAAPGAVHPERRAGESLDAFSRRMEAIMIRDALARCDGNKARAARELGLSRTTFYHKLAQIDRGT